MSIDAGLALVVGALLLAAIAARVLALLAVGKQPRRWDLLSLAARLLAAVFLAVDLGLLAARYGRWSPLVPAQVALSLGLGILILHLVFRLRYRVDGAGPPADSVALGLVIWMAWAPLPAAQAQTCAQHLALFQAGWVLFLFGAAGAILMGSTGLVIALHAWLVRRDWDVWLPNQVDVFDFLKGATALTLVVLGAGLLVTAWWAWQTMGLLSSGDPREGWMAVAWIVAAMSWLGWWLSERGSRWAAVLAGLAALVAIWSLLPSIAPYQLLGI
jgi:hypothetical protein